MSAEFRRCKSRIITYLGNDGIMNWLLQQKLEMTQETWALSITRALRG